MSSTTRQDFLTADTPKALEQKLGAYLTKAHPGVNLTVVGIQDSRVVITITLPLEHTRFGQVQVMIPSSLDEAPPVKTLNDFSEEEIRDKSRALRHQAIYANYEGNV